MFIVAIILAVLAIAALVGSWFVPAQTPVDRYGDGGSRPRRIVRLVSAGLGAVALIAMATTVVYSQDPGEAKVLKNWSGAVEGHDIKEGWDLKAPWVDAIDYDIRNQQAVYIGTGLDDYNGKKPDGPQITVQDKDGVSANVDVAVRYSIRPDSVEEVYKEFGPQENFKARLINQDIRAVVRNAPTQFSTIDVLTKRGEIETSIAKDLASRWEKAGVQVESVALQEIRYPDDVKQRFSDAQNARTQIVKAQAELEAAQISAQQKVVQAESEAKANAVLAASLTDPILRQRYLDTLKELANAGNLVVVPEGGGNQILNIPAK